MILSNTSYNLEMLSNDNNDRNIEINKVAMI